MSEESQLQEIDKVNLAQKFSQIEDHWNPRIVGELNGQQVKLAKFLGPFEWHHHEQEDEFFLVIKGQFEMHLRDKVVLLNPGEFLIIPKGVEHKPIANAEAEVLMFEPASTVNTGNLEDSTRTRENLERL
jgi:mannose-6-phosphate isomerase-like protein (cupin superfamily)